MSVLIIIAICIGSFLLFLFLLYWLLALIAHCTLYPKCKDSRDMVNKTVIVTGGTAGIGTECVYDLYLKGAKVVFTGRNAKNVKSTILNELEKRISKKMNQGSAITPELLRSVTRSSKMVNGMKMIISLPNISPLENWVRPR